MKETTKKITALFDNLSLNEEEKKTRDEIIEYIRLEKSYSHIDIHALSLIYAYGVLNRVIDPNKGRIDGENVANNGFSPYCLKARNDLTHDVRKITNMSLWSERLNRLYMNRKDVIKVRPSSKTYTSIDSEYQLALKDNGARDILGDGMDYYQEAYCLILEYLEKTDFDLTKEVEYTRKSKSGKVVIMDDETVDIPDETVKDTATKVINRDLRAMIEKDRAVRYDPNSSYLYEEFTSANDEVFYIRYSKYADLGSYDSHDIYTASNATTAQAKVNKLKKVLSPAEKKIFEYGFKGASIGAIADKLGVSRSTVRTHQKRIYKKAVQLGLVQADKVEK